MAQHLAGRLLLVVPVLSGVLLIGFVLLQVVPADPAAIIAGDAASPEVIAAIRRDLGLDRPLAWQFLLYVERVAHGDLGRSLINNVPVIEELAGTIGPTVELMLAAMSWSIPTAILFGVVGARRRGGLVDRLVMALSVAGVSMPVFTIGLLLIQLLGYYWQLLPFQGRDGPVWTSSGLLHLILPALTLGSILIGPVARMTRTTLLEVLGDDYVRTARAKGLSEGRVLLHHALRNALIPIVTLIGLQAGYLLGGSVVTETLFAWPGVGRLAVGAIAASDFPMAQGTILVLAMSFIVINLAVDVLYAYLDPRMTPGGHG